MRRLSPPGRTEPFRSKISSQRQMPKWSRLRSLRGWASSAWFGLPVIKRMAKLVDHRHLRSTLRASLPSANRFTSATATI